MKRLYNPVSRTAFDDNGAVVVVADPQECVDADPEVDAAMEEAFDAGFVAGKRELLNQLLDAAKKDGHHKLRLDSRIGRLVLAIAYTTKVESGPRTLSALGEALGVSPVAAYKLTKKSLSWLTSKTS